MANRHHHTSSTLLLDRKKVVFVKPSKPTPSHVLSFSTFDNDRNIELLCHTVYVYNSNSDSTNASTQQRDPVTVIKEALSRVLVHYYPLAGKLSRHSDGKLRITCCNHDDGDGDGDGVPFLEATANCELSWLSLLDGGVVEVHHAEQLVFDFDYHPLVLQVTRFSCGGFTIGMGLSHSVCDGLGAAQFYRALAELGSGKSEPSVEPVWERERLVATGPAQNHIVAQLLTRPSIPSSPYLPTTNLIHRCFDVKPESIQKLKAVMTEETGLTTFTTFEVLAAYVWRSRFRALKQNRDEKTFLSLLVGIRHLIIPPLPAGYYGNACAPANVELVGRELDERPLSDVAGLIKERKGVASRDEYVRESLSVCEAIRRGNVRFGGDGRMMVLTDWRRLGLVEGVDFGWNGTVNLVPLPWNLFGFVDFCVFLQPPPCGLDPSMKDGVRVRVSLPTAAMPKFKEEMDALQ